MTDQLLPLLDQATVIRAISPLSANSIEHDLAFAGRVQDALLLKLSEQWRATFDALQGAFDTPAARLNDSSEFAVDARVRLIEFHRILTAQIDRAAVAAAEHPPLARVRKPQGDANARRLRRLLQRLVDGECPRCSLSEYEQLRLMVPDALQLERLHGAGSSSYSLVPLHTAVKTDAAVKAWLDNN